MGAWLVAALLACGRSPVAADPAPPPAPPSGLTEVASLGLEADLERSTAFFASRSPWERPFATGFEVVPGLPDLSARTCAACHPDHHAEWQTSVHAQAWVDPQYQAEIGKSGNRWLCLNCHTPLLRQQDLWPSGLVGGDVELPVLAPNPAFDDQLRDEGITCAACHVRDGAIAGPGSGGAAPHPVVVDPDLRSGALCRRCHDVQVVYPGKSFVCTFETGLELDAGSWAAEGATCVTCHMPVGRRAAAVGGPEREVARHWWRGAGIPKFADGPYPPPEANRFGLELGLVIEGDEAVVTMTNAHAGHRLPTGDPERWVQVDVRFLDQAGAELGNHTLEVRQEWAWEVPPRKVADNRLAPRESRETRLALPAGAVTVEAVATNHRISAQNAEYHHLGDYPRSVEVARVSAERK